MPQEIGEGWLLKQSWVKFSWVTHSQWSESKDKLQIAERQFVCVPFYLLLIFNFVHIIRLIVCSLEKIVSA